MRKTIAAVLCTLLFATANFATAETDWSTWDTKNQHKMILAIMGWSFTKSDLLHLKVKDRFRYDDLYNTCKKAYFGFRMTGPKKFQDANFEYVADVAIEYMEGDPETFKDFMNIFSDMDNRDTYASALTEAIYGDEFQWYKTNKPEMVEMTLHTASRVFDFNHVTSGLISDVIEEDVYPAKSGI